MSISETDRGILIKRNIKKTDETIEDILFLIENGKLNIAVNRIYYGIFYILTALAIKDQFLTRKHQQLIGWFNKTYIKTGKIEKKYGAVIHNAYDMRTKGDYGDFTDFSHEMVDEMFEDMKSLIHIIKNAIGA